MKNIIIDKTSAGKRIDKFLKEGVFLNREITRGEIIRNIKDGKILVNDKVVKPSYILKEKDEISMNLEKEKKKLLPNKNIKLEIIYQDKNIIVVNKPAGLTVHLTSIEKENTLVNFLIYKFPEIKNVHDDSKDSWMRPGIVHRLDKDTSGVMVIARNQKTFDELKNKFAKREVEKKYITIVQENLKNKSGIIEAPIARAANFKKQKIARGKIKGTARPAITEYKVVKNYENFSLVEARPRTGRMHQIRVHLASIGHPVVGDRKYRFKNQNIPAGVKRQLLHAKSLKFELFGKSYFFHAEFPKDMSEFLKGLTLLEVL